MKLPLSFLVFLFLVNAANAQTSIQEYNFLTQEYKSLVSKGEEPVLTGYYLEDLLELADRSGRVKLLYRNDQESIVPIATQLHLYTDAGTYYVCVPHENSSKEIFNRYNSDIQQIFSRSSQAQSVFSILMVQYPIELQKFYEEIKELELAYANNTSSNNNNTSIIEKPQPVNTTISKPNNNNSLPNNNSSTAKSAQQEDVIIITNNQNVELKTYETPKIERTASGFNTNELSASLRSRKLVARPELINTTGKAGMVRIDICISDSGKVLSAKHNAKGSDTQNRDLIELSLKFAKKYTFSKSSQSRKCGYIVFRYN